MSNPHLRPVDNQVVHPRDLARRKVQQWREGEVQPIVNQHDSGAPSLRTDEVLRRSEPQHDRRR